VRPLTVFDIAAPTGRRPAQALQFHIIWHPDTGRHAKPLKSLNPRGAPGGGGGPFSTATYPDDPDELDDLDGVFPLPFSQREKVARRAARSLKDG
jgi:hypothetical protein